jgi:fructose-bisphosphate aldolase class I
MNTDMRTQMGSGKGFIAALDQSGGSTPKALQLYGVDESAYSGEAEMFDLVHAMRSRIITNSAFNGDRVIAAILFEMTMDRDIEGQPTPS